MIPEPPCPVPPHLEQPRLLAADRADAAQPPLQPPLVAMTYRPSRGVRVPIGRAGLALADPHMEAEFVDADVTPIVVERLPWVCALMAVFDALHLAARVAEWPLAGGAPIDARLACACLLPGVVVWALLGLAAAAARAASARPGAPIPLRALSVALAAALFLDALPLDVLAQPSLVRDGAAPALAALALQQLLAPVAVSCFCPLAPMALLVSGVTAVCSFALAGSRAALDVGVVAQCTVTQAALVAFLVAHRWDAGAIERRHFYRARQAWLAHVRTLAAKQNAEQLHAAVLSAKADAALAAANDAAATARAELIRILSHDIRGPLLIAANVAGEMEELSEDTKTAPPSQPAPVDCETFARLAAQLHDATHTMSRIVSQLADFGRAEANDARLERRAFSLGALAAAVTRAATARAEAKGLRLWAPALADKAASVRVTADFALLAQAIDAGVSNAVNASAAGAQLTLSLALAPEIDQQLLELEAEPSTAGWVLVLVRVVDAGAGLAADKLEAVRQGKVFAGVSESQLNGAVATGVGLAHTRRILALHDESTLSLHSDGRGRGCTFELRLRLRRAHADDACWLPPEPAEGARPSLERGEARAPPPPVARLARGAPGEEPARRAQRSVGVQTAPAEGAHADGSQQGALEPSPSSLGARVRGALHYPGAKLASVRRRSPTVSDVAVESVAAAAAEAGGAQPGGGAGSATPSRWRNAIVRTHSAKLSAPGGASTGGGGGGEHSRRGSGATTSGLPTPGSAAPSGRTSSGDYSARWRPRPSAGSHTPSDAGGDFTISKMARASAQTLLAGLMGGSTNASPTRAHASAVAPTSSRHASPGWLRAGALGSATRVAPSAAVIAARTAKAPKPTFPPGFRALYAEDDPVLRKSVVLRVFRPLGVAVDEACDGAEALRLCDARERELGRDEAAYAFVLLDNQMPSKTGSEVAQELRRRGYTASQIVGMTGDPRGCTDRAVFEVSGVDVCLDKDAAAVRKVREMLAAYAIDAADAAAPASTSAAPHVIEPMPPSPTAKMDTIPDDPTSETPSDRLSRGH